MKILKLIFCATLAVSVVTSANSAGFKKDDLKNKVTDKISSFKSEKINQYSTEISDGISSFLKENLSSLKYLDFQVDLSQSWMIGDNQTDFDAGINAGCKAIKISDASELENCLDQIFFKH